MNRAVLQRALDALHLARNGLVWYQNQYPEVVDGSDDEARQEIDAAINDLNDELSKPVLTAAQIEERIGYRLPTHTMVLLLELL